MVSWLSLTCGQFPFFARFYDPPIPNGAFRDIGYRATRCVLWDVTSVSPRRCDPSLCWIVNVDL